MAENSLRLRADDLRFVYLLIGECCELGADPLIWRRHMLHRLNARFGAVASVDIAAVFDSQSQPNPRVDVAITLDQFTAAEREILTRCLREMRMEDNALGIALVNESRTRSIVTGTRQEWVRARDWQKCGFVTDYAAPLGWNESLMGITALPGGFRCFNFMRERSDRCFPARDARILELLARELVAIPETRLAPMAGPSLVSIPTRLRQVLAGIMHGDSEQQIAAALGISRSTVHEYVRRLYRRFNVGSRGALLARVARQLHAFEIVTDDESRDCWFFQQSSNTSRAG